MTDALKLPANVDVLDACEVCVVGGGLAGVAATLSFAAEGIDTVLVEERGALAWEISHGLEIHLGKQELPATLARIVAELEKLNATRGGILDPVATECLMDKLIREAGVRVHFRAFAAGYDAKEKLLRLTTKSGPLAIRARAVIDATENSRIARNSGARFNTGVIASATQTRNFLLCNVTPPGAPEIIQAGQNEVTLNPTLWPHEAHVTVKFSVTSPEKSESQARFAMAQAVETLRASKAGFENASIALSAHDGFSVNVAKLDVASLADGLTVAGPALLGRKPTLQERAHMGEQAASAVTEEIRSAVVRK
jgi:hypothetical protein